MTVVLGGKPEGHDLNAEAADLLCESCQGAGLGTPSNH
jgi:hypothetical protein